MGSIARSVALAASALLLTLGFCGCVEKSGLWGAKSTASQSPQEPRVTPPSPPPVPYRLVARASGPTIEFTIVNDGESDLRVSPKDFALIPSGTRRVVPYDPETVTIDVPSSVPAKGRISGRAMFKEFPTPTGHRLVFKPDQHGTYADIIGLF
ncbi:MAG: hypothetical protein N2111_01450 [Candidatus Sumerlaeaceae bacterium]|nr:hypothetical protein [Candidatus Sumerlaeaceae bacterium]